MYYIDKIDDYYYYATTTSQQQHHPLLLLFFLPIPSTNPLTFDKQKLDNICVAQIVSLKVHRHVLVNYCNSWGRARRL